MPDFARSRPLRLASLLIVLSLVAAPRRARTEDADGAVRRAFALVSEAGAWRIGADALRARGFASPAEVEVTRGGRAVPSVVVGDAVVFVASNPAGPHGRVGLYEVRRRASAARLPALRARRDGESTAGPPVAVATFARDVYHGDLAAGPHEVYGVEGTPTWFLAPLDPQGVAEIDASTSLSMPAAGDGRLLVRVYATHAGRVRLRALIDDEGLGATEVSHAVGGATLAFDVPAAALGDLRRVRLVDESPPLAPPAKDDVTRAYGRMWVDALRVEAPIDGALDASGGPRILHAVPGLSVPAPSAPGGIAAVERDGVAVGAAVVWTTELVAGTDVENGDRVVLTAAPRDLPELRAAPDLPDPLAATRGAAHVIVATPPLVPAARRLAAHRTKEGLPSVVVPSTAIWWHFGAGEASPAALRTFVRTLLAEPQPALRYLVLAGDATFDRIDLAEDPTIPTPMARTKYNGATSSDRLYARALDEGETGGVPVGRLPFRDPAAFSTYVDRLIRYETELPPDPTRRRLRFITSEGRFGALIDGMLESAFRSILTTSIPDVYDVEVTYANLRSNWLWPPRRFADKVVDDLSEGALFVTYVGHGFEKGFDRLRVGRESYPILDMAAVERVDVRGTPPVLLVLACTTAMFDGISGPGVNEALLARPRGPIACWGATRDCHPAANTLLGIEMATSLGKARPGTRLGDLLHEAIERAVRGDGGGRLVRAVMSLMSGQGYDLDPDRLTVEASWMYTLLGDPATRLALVPMDAAIEIVGADGDGIDVVVTASAADGAEVVVKRLRSRGRPVNLGRLKGDPASPDTEAEIRERHARVNDLTLETASAILEGGRARVRIPGAASAGEVVQAVVSDATTLIHGSHALVEADLAR